MKYKVSYKDIEIGTLEVNEEGQHKYTPNQEGIEKIKDQTVLLHEMLEPDEDFGDPIPFFQNRLRNNEKFRNRKSKEINSHTDKYSLKQELEQDR